MIIDCVSDLHGAYPTLEGGDLLIVAGDLTATDDLEEYWIFYEWLDNQEYVRKVIIAGNHDTELEKKQYFGRTDGFYPSIYLQDSGTQFRGLKIWGSAWTKTFDGMNPDYMAFTCETEEELAEKWEKIPLNTEILITHGPPFGMMDQSSNYVRCGSESLAKRLLKLKKLKLHVFGHIHEGYGVHPYHNGYKGLVYQSVNASIMDKNYKPINAPIRVII